MKWMMKAFFLDYLLMSEKKRFVIIFHDFHLFIYYYEHLLWNMKRLSRSRVKTKKKIFIINIHDIKHQIRCENFFIFDDIFHCYSIAKYHVQCYHIISLLFVFIVFFNAIAVCSYFNVVINKNDIRFNVIHTLIHVNAWSLFACVFW